MRSALPLALSLLLSGCGAFGTVTAPVSDFFERGGVRGKLTVVDGLRFRTRLSTTTEDRRGFVTSTGKAARNVPAAAEAARVTAVQYCLLTFGGSDILWAVGSDPASGVARPQANGALALSGACVTR